MKLTQPSAQYKISFIEAYKEDYSKNPRDKYYESLNIEELESDFKNYVEKTIFHSQGKNQPKGYVPETTYWLVDNDEFIGRINIRHQLNEHLLRVGGHIGYDICPSQR